MAGPIFHPLRARGAFKRAYGSSLASAPDAILAILRFYREHRARSCRVESDGDLLAFADGSIGGHVPWRTSRPTRSFSALEITRVMRGGVAANLFRGLGAQIPRPVTELRFTCEIDWRDEDDPLEALDGTDGLWGSSNSIVLTRPGDRPELEAELEQSPLFVALRRAPRTYQRLRLRRLLRPSRAAVCHVIEPRDELDQRFLDLVGWGDAAWIALDEDGALGVFWTMGDGPVPEDFLLDDNELVRLRTAFKEECEELLGRQDASAYRPNVGWYVPKTPGLKAIYEFNWTNGTRYERVSFMEDPADAKVLPPRLEHARSTFPVLPVRFADCTTFDLAELVPYRRFEDIWRTIDD